MVGIVVVTHGNIGTEMIEATRHIIPEVRHLIAVGVAPDTPPSLIREHISDAIQKVENSEGVLILTDMFGGTPSNICLSFLKLSHIEVISGVNLPMLIKLASMRASFSFREMVEFIQHYGRRNIVVASSILNHGTEQSS